jgi:hypothetical protein
VATVLLQPCRVGDWVRGAITAAVRSLPPPVSAPPPLPQQAPQPAAPPPESLPPRDQLPTVADAIVLRALDQEQAAFTRCFTRAHERDPTLGTTKVELHVILDPDGAVRAVDLDAQDNKLATCLANVARQLHFPAPGRFAVANIALVG